MAFWIFIGLIVLTWVIATIWEFSNSNHRRWGGIDGAGFYSAFFVTIGLFFLGAVTIGMGLSVSQTRPTGHEKIAEYNLRALVTKESVESSGEASFFLGFGGGSSSSGTVQSISYIRVAKDGGSSLRKADIADSVIYEDGEAQPRMETWTATWRNNGAFWPWPFTQEVGDHQYRFHIPAGSILESYEVKP